MERYIELPLYDLLVRISGGDGPGGDAGIGDGVASVDAVGDTEGAGDNLV